jgi:hypothetical protein
MAERADGTLPEDFELVVEGEVDDLLAETKAITPDEMRKVAEGMALRIANYDGSTIMARRIVERVLERADTLEARPN